MKQMDLIELPRQRVRLVEAGPRVAVNLESETRRSPGENPIKIFPGLILDARYQEELKTEWFDPRTHLPKVSGFYEITVMKPMAGWYHQPEYVFYTSSGTRYDGNAAEPGFLWRGCVEALGRRRRIILEN